MLNKNDKDKNNYIKSYGILCFNKVNNETKVLLVKRKYTYEFFHFTTSNYHFTKQNIIKLFNKMTIDEKRLILFFDFDLLWKKLSYDIDSFNNIIYSKCKRLYNLNVLENKEVVIKEICNSENLKDSECDLWSTPKGRKNYPEENKYIVAMREFSEETNIPKNNYYINFDFKRYYILDNKYKINYYIAIYRNNKRVNLDYTDLKLLNEINGINWFSLEEIQKECNYLYKHIKPAFTFVKNNDLLL